MEKLQFSLVHNRGCTFSCYCWSCYESRRARYVSYCCDPSTGQFCIVQFSLIRVAMEMFYLRFFGVCFVIIFCLPSLRMSYNRILYVFAQLFIYLCLFSYFQSYIYIFLLNAFTVKKKNDKKHKYLNHSFFFFFFL